MFNLLVILKNLIKRFISFSFSFSFWVKLPQNFISLYGSLPLGLLSLIIFGIKLGLIYTFLDYYPLFNNFDGSHSLMFTFPFSVAPKIMLLADGVNDKSTMKLYKLNDVYDPYYVTTLHNIWSLAFSNSDFLSFGNVKRVDIYALNNLGEYVFICGCVVRNGMDFDEFLDAVDFENIEDILSEEYTTFILATSIDKSGFQRFRLTISYYMVNVYNKIAKYWNSLLLSKSGNPHISKIVNGSLSGQKVTSFTLSNVEGLSMYYVLRSIYNVLWSNLFFKGLSDKLLYVTKYNSKSGRYELVHSPVKVNNYTSFIKYYYGCFNIKNIKGNSEYLVMVVSIDPNKKVKYPNLNLLIKKLGHYTPSSIRFKKYYLVVVGMLIYVYYLDCNVINIFSNNFNNDSILSVSVFGLSLSDYFKREIASKAELREVVSNRGGDKNMIRIEVNTPSRNHPVEALSDLHGALWKFDEFLKHGSKKIMFVTAFSRSQGHQVAFHPNILVTNDTTLEEYRSKVIDYLNSYDARYVEYEPFTKFMVTVVDATKFQGKEINVVKVNNAYGGYESTRISVSPKKGSRSYSSLVKPNGRRLFSTSCCNNHSTGISKLKKIPVNLKSIATVDIETIILDPVTRVHVPIAISTVSKDFKKLFIIDRDLLEIDPQKAVAKLFKDYLEFMQSLNKSYIIFAHNLGGYDGIIMYKNFLQFPDKIHNFKCLIDADHRFISIDYRYSYISGRMKTAKNITLTWKDSLRLFPGSLESLCKQFNVAGKISKYDMAFNNISLFDNAELLERFKEYSLQDSIALYDALITAQKIYFENYKVDICSTYSTASLAFKIYRTKFIQHEIPLLSHSEDAFIRKAYFGGATDYYKACGEELYWYDVNSLYPYAMMGDLPFKIVKKHKTLSGVNVKDFKGFVKAKITSPDNIKHPIVPYRLDKVYYPTGTWTGIYFSDLLAKAQTFGYKIELIEGIEFEYIDLFSDYIKHFYEIKKTSTGSLKYLAKLKLNSLYGMFGRRKDTLTTENVLTEDLDNYLLKNNVTNIVKINDRVSTVISEDVPNKKMLRELNTLLTGHDIGSSGESTALANVAIAAAITARAQMIMMDYKNNPDFDVYYTDTDSIFTDKPLPSHLVGDALGQMKNESLDKWGVEKIDKACFVGIKKYGLSVTDSKGVLHESSVFSGVPRNSLSYNEVLQIQSGVVIERNIDNRFVKNFENLEISNQKAFILHISNKRDKVLSNNNYLPISVKNLHPTRFKTIVEKIVRRITYLKRKYL